MTQAVSGLKTAASGGGFTVDPQGGQYLINALNSLESKIDLALQRARVLAHEPDLGTTPAAQVYKPFFASVVSDQHQGAITAWLQLKKDIGDAINTLQTAMNNYQQTDQSNAGHLHGPQ